MHRGLPLVALVCLAAVALGEERIAAAAKDDVEVALYASKDGKQARVTVDNRGACAKTVSFSIVTSISGDPLHRSLVVPPGGQAGRDEWFPIDGNAAQAGLTIDAVRETVISVQDGYQLLASGTRDGLVASLFGAPGRPGRGWLTFANRADHAVVARYTLAGAAREQRVPAHATLGAHGEIEVAATADAALALTAVAAAR